MEKKDVDAKGIVTHIILGFVSYTMIIGFMCFIVLLVVYYFLDNFSGTSVRGLYITLPLMAAIITYLIIHGICKLSTYDVFKSSKTNPSNYKTIVKYLNMFFIACIILSICIFLELLYVNLSFHAKTIEYTMLQYKSVFSEQHAAILAEEMINSYNFSKTNLVIATVILVIGVTVSLLSLIPYQKKMILKYNEPEKNS